MFKDLYKNANDKIPTEDAYLRVMENVKTKSRKTKYTYAKIIALAACFLLTFSMISVYENFRPKEDVPFEVITPENLTADVPVVAKEIPVPEVQPKVASIAETGEPMIETEPVEEIQPETEEPAVEAEITEDVTPAPENSFVKNQGIPENIGTNTARFTLGDTVTKETYYEYLGKNVEELIALPDSFINETPDEHNLCLTENENFDDRWTFYFTKEESSIFLTTTKNTATTLNILGSEEYQISNISEIPVCLFEEDLQKIACFEVGGIAYTLSSYGVDDEDFKNIIISLTK